MSFWVFLWVLTSHFSAFIHNFWKTYDWITYTSSHLCTSCNSMVPKKRDVDGSEDLSSDLPDALIGHILSFLTTKEAASTSVLSTKWRYLFAFVSNLDFDNDGVICREEINISTDTMTMDRSFMDFVDRVLALQGNSHVDKFSLKIKDDSDDSIDLNRIFGWIRNVLQRGVSDLSLYMGFDLESEVMFPSKIFSSKTLVRLKLVFGYSPTMDIGKVDLPKLKTLYLDSVDFEEDGIGFTKFLSGCPMLEDLVMDRIYWFAWDFASVSVTTLKRLTLYAVGCDRNPKSVSFDTPNLAYLDYTDTVADKYPKVNFGSLVEAKINLRMSDSNATDFITGIRNVKILDLSSDTLEVLIYCCNAIPLFNNLTHLTIENNPDIGWQSLPGLLKNSPNLETLVLQGLLYKAIDEWRYYEEEEEIHTSLSSTPVKVLKIMEFDAIGPEELEQVKYLLATMPNLEQLILHIEIPFEEEAVTEMLSQLEILPKGIASSKCHLKIITEQLCVSSIVP